MDLVLTDGNARVIRSRRKTFGLQIDRDGTLIVRAPQRATDRQIRSVVETHRDWIEKHRAISEARLAAHPEPSPEERSELIRQAREILPAKAAFYAERMGVRPTRITITGARTRFGSCSGKNAVCFSWRLMQYPEEAIDYVVVHELAHIRHHDHSSAFYAFVSSILPDHRERRALLRK